MTNLHTSRLTLVPIPEASLVSEAAGGPPILAGINISSWPPEHWEPHVFPHIRSQRAAHPGTEGWHRYIILNATSDVPPQLIGTLGASPRAEADVEFGYSVLPAFQRRGLGTEAAQAFAAWLAAQPGVHSLSAQTLPSLPASIRVMLACGLTFAGQGDEAGTLRYRKVLAAKPTAAGPAPTPSASSRRSEA